MRLKNNISALNASVALSINEAKLSKDLEKLTSGFRINRAGDDAAGLAISEAMRSLISGMAQAELNARDGVGLLRTGEGAMQEIHVMLTQLNELAVQSANGVYEDDKHRALMQEEANRISEEIDRIAKATRFNYVNLFQDVGPDAEGIAVTTAATAASGATGSKVQTFALPGTSAKVDDLAGTTGSQSSPEQIAAQMMPGISDEAEAEAAAAEPELTLPGNGTENYDYPDWFLQGYAEGVTQAASLPGTGTAESDVENQVSSDKMKAALEAGTNLLTGNSAVSGSGADHQRGRSQYMAALSKDAGKAAPNAKAGNSGTLTPDTGAITFQIGPYAADSISIPRFYLSSKALGLDQFDISTQESANASITEVKNMVDRVSYIRGKYGAAENALEHAINSVNIAKENLTAAESRIRDTDMTQQLTEYAKSNILRQSAQAMLAQANALPQSVLEMIR